MSDCGSTARGRICDSVGDQVVLVQTDRLEAVFGVELNDTLKKPTPRSNSLRQGFARQELRGIYGFLPFGTGCRPTRCFFRTLQQQPSPRLRPVKSYRE